jgi:hypothetical protein
MQGRAVEKVAFFTKSDLIVFYFFADLFILKLEKIMLGYKESVSANHFILLYYFITFLYLSFH